MALSKACRQSWDLNRHLPMQQKQWVQRPWGIELLRGGRLSAWCGIPSKDQVVQGWTLSPGRLWGCSPG